jgi:hypothetical protein
MSDLKIAVPGLDYVTELNTTQTAIAYSGNNFTVSFSNNICTVTTTTAHGLTFSPSAGTLPNFFVTFSGVTGMSGTGTLNGPIFQILTIPSTTTFTFYTTVTAATVTSASILPVFIPVFQAALLTSVSDYNPNLSTGQTLPLYGSAQCVNLTLGANLVAYYNPDNTNVVQTSSSGNTLATAPTKRTMLAASSGGQLRFGPQDYLLATASSGTSYLSIVE